MGTRDWESTSIPLQWADPLPLLTIPDTPRVGRDVFLDEDCPARGFVSVTPSSLEGQGGTVRGEADPSAGGFSTCAVQLDDPERSMDTPSSPL